MFGAWTQNANSDAITNDGNDVSVTVPSGQQDMFVQTSGGTPAFRVTGSDGTAATSSPT